MTKERLIKCALLLSLCGMLLFVILAYYKILENTNKTILLLEDGYLEAANGSSDHYSFGEADRRLNPKGVICGVVYVPLLDSIYNRYSYKFSEANPWTSATLLDQNVSMDKNDVMQLSVILQGYCDSFDSLFKQPYAIFYRDTIPLNFIHARKELEKLKQMIPKDRKVILYKPFLLNYMNGNEFAMIYSEWKFRFDDFVYAYELDMGPVQNKICEESIREWNKRQNEK